MNDLDTIRKSINSFVSDVKNRKFATERSSFVNEVSQEVVRIFQPLLQHMAENSRMNKEDLRTVAEEIATKINIPEIKIPELIMPTIHVPEPRVTVNVPKADAVRVPDVKMPDRMQVQGNVSIDGVDLNNPFPVQLRDHKGNPVNLFEHLTSISGGGSGGKSDFFTIKGFNQSAFAELMNPDGRLKVELPSGSSGLTDAELRASSVPVAQVSGSIWSTEVTNTVTVSASNLDIRDLVSASDAVSSYQVSGANWSTEVTNPFATTTSSTMVNGDGRLMVSVETGGSGLTDAELRATAVPVSQLSGASWSTEASQAGTWNIATVTTVTGVTNTIAAALVNSSGVQYSGSNPLPIVGPVVVTSITNTSAANIVDSTGVGYSGSNPMPITGTVVVSSVTATIAAHNVDSTGVGYSGSNPVPITWVSGAGVSTTVNIGDSSGVGYSGSNPLPITWVSGAGASIAANISDSSGIGYSGSNPLPITIVAGAGNSTISVGAVVADVADDGSAPNKIGGIARTANPTAVANGDIVSVTMDKVGRQITMPVTVRDLRATAHVQISNGTETTLYAAQAGFYTDLIYLMGANNSDAAVSVSIRPVTAGNVVLTIQIPASGTAGIACPVPLPASDTGNNWTADMSDITGTTVSLTALFSKEV